MKYQVTDYPFNISPLSADEGGGWLLSYPDVPHLVVAGNDVDEIIAEGRLVLADALQLLAENGHPLPEPGSGGSFKGKMTLRMPKTLHASLAARARAEGVSLNTMAVTLVSQGLAKKHA